MTTSPKQTKSTSLISVVIPAYNAGKTLSKSITSVLNQSILPTKIIIIDDGSTDNTLSVADTFTDHVTVISQANQGSASARQTGTNEVTTRYIAYLDADDWWTKDKIEKLVNIIELYNPDFLLSDLNRASEIEGVLQHLPNNSTFYPSSLKLIQSVTNHTRINNLYKIEQSQALAIILNGFPVYPSTMMAKVSNVKEVGGWNSNFKRCQDFDLGLRLVKKFPLFFYNETLSTLGIHNANSNVLTYVEMQTKGDIKVLHNHIKESKNNPPYAQQCKKSMAKKYLILAITRYKLRQYREAKNDCIRAFKLPGKRIKALYYLLKFSLQPSKSSNI